jgi:hypothetical protein
VPVQKYNLSGTNYAVHGRAAFLILKSKPSKPAAAAVV